MNRTLPKLRHRRGSGIAIGLVLLAALLLSAGCERPFVPPLAPSIEVISPSFTTVLLSPRVELAVEVSSFRDIDRVELDGDRMAYDAEEGVWRFSLLLRPGLNRLVLEAFDVEQVSRRDTLDAVYLPLEIGSGNPRDWATPRGGHAASQLPDGRILLTGGSAAADSPAEPDAFLLDPGQGTIRLLEQGLAVPRAGHMAVNLDDGRILILGGSRRDVDQSKSDGLEGLVAEVELFDPATESFTTLPFAGASPIRRTGGTALRVRLPDLPPEETVVVLFGGLGDIRYGATPRWGVRRDLRSFIFRRDTLSTWGPPTGSPVEAMAGHTQTPLQTDPATGLGRYLLAGAYIPPYATHPSDVENRVFVLRFTAFDGTSRQEAGGFVVPRRRHAAERLSGDLVLFSGGLRFGSDPVLSSVEVFSDAAFRAFGFPESVELLKKRWGHSATISPDQRILVVGGFGSDGRAVARIEHVYIASTSD